MKRWVLALVSSLTFLTAALVAPGMALAYGGGTADTDPPAEEEVCNGLGGHMWGPGVAYCEAQDCRGSNP